MDFVFDGVKAVFITAAANYAAPNPSDGKPHRESIRTVVAPAGVFLGNGCAAKFSAPSDESFVEETAFLEVLEQRGHGLVHVPGVVHVPRFEIDMLVPAIRPFRQSAVSLRRNERCIPLIYEPADIA